MNYKTKSAFLVACTLAFGVASAPQSALSGECDVTPPLQQTGLPRPIELGVSGGNIHSVIKFKKERGCFSGTLGSMVQDSNDVQYILSNNHVLADQNNAKPGQLIVQPGKVDVECAKSPSNAVATFTSAVKLKFGGPANTVDAAIAQVEEGQVSPEILFIGGISSSVASPEIGMQVLKMGRTSCLTSGVIAALDANFPKISYSDNPKRPKSARFIDQLVVTGNPSTPIFGAGGDSGSLIVTDSDCPQPVGLLFAGFSNGNVIANPISSVLSALGVSMVGSCSDALAPGIQGLAAADMGLSTEVVALSKSVRDRHENQLMNIAGAVGTGIGAGDQPGQAAIVVYVEKMSSQAQAAAPKDIEGVPVKLIESGAPFAY